MQEKLEARNISRMSRKLIRILNSKKTTGGAKKEARGQLIRIGDEEVIKYFIEEFYEGFKEFSIALPPNQEVIDSLIRIGDQRAIYFLIGFINSDNRGYANCSRAALKSLGKKAEDPLLSILMYNASMYTCRATPELLAEIGDVTTESKLEYLRNFAPDEDSKVAISMALRFMKGKSIREVIEEPAENGKTSQHLSNEFEGLEHKLEQEFNSYKQYLEYKPKTPLSEKIFSTALYPLYLTFSGLDYLFDAEGIGIQYRIKDYVCGIILGYKHKGLLSKLKDKQVEFVSSFGEGKNRNVTMILRADIVYLNLLYPKAHPYPAETFFLRRKFTKELIEDENNSFCWNESKDFFYTCPLTPHMGFFLKRKGIIKFLCPECETWYEGKKLRSKRWSYQFAPLCGAEGETYICPEKHEFLKVTHGMS